jgi:UDP-glucose 4-epimerase
MKCLVTGGSGFIGSHVVDGLLAEGHHVCIYDLDAPRYHQPCEFVRGDTRDTTRLVNVSKGFDAIYHLAAEANVNRFYESPVYSNDITAGATLTVLEAARLAQVGRVLVASTEWIYGSIEGNDQDFITEEMPYAQNPDHIYTASKIATELFCRNYKTLYGVNYTIMRFGIPFGERARAETVTPIFLRKILNGEEITIHGDGSQTRQFIYVKELARGNVACLQPAGENQIFNLNGQRKISVLDIVATLEKILNKKAKCRMVEDRKGNFKGRFISSEKAKTLLGWEVQTGYEEAMRNYVTHVLENR